MTDKRKQIIKAIKTGKFFTIKFVKKNGELRELNGRLGVKKHLKGGELGYSKVGNWVMTLLHSIILLYLM